MTWFRTCDGFARHAKLRRIGPKGHNLWHIVGVECTREDTDGFIDPFMLADSYAGLAWLPGKKWEPVAAALVDAGLWHNSTTIASCQRCATLIEAGPPNRGRTSRGKLEDGWYYIHDWQDYQLDKEGKEDPLARKRETRRKWFTKCAEGKQMRAEIRERDRDLCRYCGIQTKWNTNDRKSTDVGTIDHVDPFDFSTGRGGNHPDVCVVACKGCNDAKGMRTPEQWVEQDPENGRLLRPEPGPYQVQITSQTQIGSSPGLDPGPDHHGSDPGLASRDARGGPGLDPDRIGSSPDQVPGLDRAGSDQAPDGAGPPSAEGLDGRSNPTDPIPTGGSFS